jgi:hypothetical protein
VGGIKWTDKPVKTLGIYFRHDKEECEKFNWENKIEKICQLRNVNAMVYLIYLSLKLFIFLLFRILSAMISTDSTNRRADKGHH